MSVQLYSGVEVFWQSSPLLEEATVRITRDSKASVVETVGRGFAGVTPGAKQISVSIESAVPSADFEMNPGKHLSGMKVGTLTLRVGTRTLTSNGYILKDDLSHSVNSDAKLSFDFVGEYADWV